MVSGSWKNIIRPPRGSKPLYAFLPRSIIEKLSFFAPLDEQGGGQLRDIVGDLTGAFEVQAGAGTAWSRGGLRNNDDANKGLVKWGNVFNFQSNPFTIIAGVPPRSAGDDGYTHLLSKYWGVDGERSWQLGSIDGIALRMILSDDGTNYAIIDSDAGSVPLRSRMVSVVRNGTSIDLYADARKIKTGTGFSSLHVNNSNEMTILGQRKSDGTLGCNAKSAIQWAMIFDGAALSGQEIDQIFDAVGAWLSQRRFEPQWSEIFVYQGEIPASIAPESDYESVVVDIYEYDGEVPVSALPEAIYSALLVSIYEHEGEIPASIVPEGYATFGKSYAGEIPVSVLPEGKWSGAWNNDYQLLNEIWGHRDYALINAAVAVHDYALVNRISGGLFNDYALINTIKAAGYNDYAIKNRIDGPVAGYVNDYTLRNVILPATTARIIQHTWDVTLDGGSIKDYADTIRMSLDGESFTNEASVSLRGLALLESLEAHKGSAVDVLVITIDGTAYKFLVEEVEISHTERGAGLRVRGRSKTAILADPAYSDPIIKVWEDAVLASAVIAELAPGFSIQNDLEDWVIAPRTLSATNQMPMGIIQRLAEVQGGVVRSGREGELVLRPAYPTSPAALPGATPDATFYETDDLLELGDRRELSEGWNAVLVEGKATSADQPAIIIELDDERNYDRTEFKPGEEAFVRVYPRPLDLEYEHQVTLGTATKIGAFTRDVEDEKIEVSDGVASTQYPILDVIDMDWDGRELSSPEWEVGGQEIRFDVAEGCSGSAYLHLDYRAQYDLWKVKATEEGKAILCLEDKEE